MGIKDRFQHRSFAQLLDLLHIINKSLLDVVRDRQYQPREDDFLYLSKMQEMHHQLHAVNLAVTDTLTRRQKGLPEVDESIS